MCACLFFFNNQHPITAWTCNLFMVDEVWGVLTLIPNPLWGGPVLLNRYIRPLECFCLPNPKYRIQVLTICSEKESDKSPCIWRGHRGRPCATESHPKGPWPKHWLLKSTVKTTILPPAHLWAGGNMKKVWLKALWPVREGQTQMLIFCRFFCTTEGCGDISTMPSICVVCL